ncbi:MAG: prolyl oligopeptidase family serine peptidase [Chlorobi bacterium]|nr:prolyl oligopeptidase family serine peptidase [Chlorobiota bacterium]
MYGIFSWFTDWSNSFQPSFEQMYFGYNYWERPIDMNNLFVQRSPAFYVTNITTPVLILHGTKDKYTNLANSQEMYQALKELGREVEFVVYDGEGHGLRRKPANYHDSIERALVWFFKYLRVEEN